MYESATSGHALADQLRSVLRSRLGNGLDPAVERLLDELEAMVPNHPSSAGAIGGRIWHVGMRQLEYADWIIVANDEADARARLWNLVVAYIRENYADSDPDATPETYDVDGPDSQNLFVDDLGTEHLLDRGKVGE